EHETLFFAGEVSDSLAVIADIFDLDFRNGDDGFGVTDVCRFDEAGGEHIICTHGGTVLLCSVLDGIAAALALAAHAAKLCCFSCAVSTDSGVTVMVSAGTVVYFLVATRSTTRLSSLTTMLLIASSAAFTKLSASGRVVGRMSPRRAASRRL